MSNSPSKADKQESASEQTSSSAHTQTSDTEREETTNPLTDLQQRLGNQMVQRLATSAGGTGSAGGGAGGTDGSDAGTASGGPSPGTQTGETRSNSSHESGSADSQSSPQRSSTFGGQRKRLRESSDETGSTASRSGMGGKTRESGIPIGDTDTQHEQEAEQLAAAVVQPERPSKPTSTAPRAAAETTRSTDTAPKIVEEVVHSPGRSLDPDVRTEMEEKLDAQFGSVRIHTDSKAARSADAIDATAYTIGSDIVFHSGAYDPESVRGKKIIAHELAHVMQQSDSDPVAQRATLGNKLKKTFGSEPQEVKKLKEVKNRAKKIYESGPYDTATLKQLIDDARDAEATAENFLQDTRRNTAYDTEVNRRLQKLKAYHEAIWHKYQRKSTVENKIATADSANSMNRLFGGQQGQDSSEIDELYRKQELQILISDLLENLESATRASGGVGSTTKSPGWFVAKSLGKAIKGSLPLVTLAQSGKGLHGAVDDLQTQETDPDKIVEDDKGNDVSLSGSREEQAEALIADKKQGNELGVGTSAMSTSKNVEGLGEWEDPQKDNVFTRMKKRFQTLHAIRIELSRLKKQRKSLRAQKKQERDILRQQAKAATGTRGQQEAVDLVDRVEGVFYNYEKILQKTKEISEHGGSDSFEVSLTVGGGAGIGDVASAGGEGTVTFIYDWTKADDGKFIASKRVKGEGKAKVASTGVGGAELGLFAEGGITRVYDDEYQFAAHQAVSSAFRDKANAVDGKAFGQDGVEYLFDETATEGKEDVEGLSGEQKAKVKRTKQKISGLQSFVNTDHATGGEMTAGAFLSGNALGFKLDGVLRLGYSWAKKAGKAAVEILGNVPVVGSAKFEFDFAAKEFVARFQNGTGTDLVLKLKELFSSDQAAQQELSTLHNTQSQVTSETEEKLNDVSPETTQEEQKSKLWMALNHAADVVKKTINVAREVAGIALSVVKEQLGAEKQESTDQLKKSLDDDESLKSSDSDPAPKFAGSKGGGSVSEYLFKMKSVTDWRLLTARDVTTDTSSFSLKVTASDGEAYVSAGGSVASKKEFKGRESIGTESLDYVGNIFKSQYHREFEAGADSREYQWSRFYARQQKSGKLQELFENLVSNQSKVASDVQKEITNKKRNGQRRGADRLQMAYRYFKATYETNRSNWLGPSGQTQSATQIQNAREIKAAFERLLAAYTQTV